MKIFYDGAIFLQQWKGGVNRIFEELTVRLPLLDNDVQLYLHKFPESFKEAVINRQYYMVPKFGRLLREFDSLTLKAKVNSFKADIYHSTYYRTPKGLNCKKVITVYDMIHEKYSAQFGDPSEFLKLKKECVCSADKIIAISESTKKDVIDLYGIEPDKISVIYLAAGKDFKLANEAEKRELTNKYGFEKPYLLYVGQRGGYKNFLLLLKAYSIWKNRSEFDLVCIGGGKWNTEETAVINRNALTKNVKLLGYLDDNELKVVYSKAAALLYPSKYEGFGIPLLEAMACGTPVVASSISSIPEIGGNAAQYFDPDSEESLVSVLNNVVGNDKLRETMVTNGFNRQAEFSWEKTAKETYDIYCGLINK